MQRLNDTIIGQLRFEYISNPETTLTSLSSKYQINYGTLRQYSVKENWKEQRLSYKCTVEKNIIAEMERNIPREMVQQARLKLVKEIIPSINTLIAIRDGHGGKSSYNRLLACKDILDRNGIKGEEQLNIKISKITDIIDKLTITCSDTIPLTPDKQQAVLSSLTTGETTGNGGEAEHNGGETGNGGEAGKNKSVIAPHPLLINVFPLLTENVKVPSAIPAEEKKEPL